MLFRKIIYAVVTITRNKETHSVKKCEVHFMLIQLAHYTVLSFAF